jgi:CheY-like chemotaxis protein
MLERTLREDIEIRTSFECDLVRAFADAAQLESAILNLALNAKDAMPTGGTLTFGTANALLDQRYHETHLEVVPGAYVLISVTDNGTGMPPEVAERVFEPFFTTKEVGKGSGLGLSMVYGFVKQSNGHVAVYSEPGLGTTIKLYLPAAKGITASTPELPCGEEVPLGKGTVLLVEDDPFVRGYAVGCVESLGYRVITASNGHDALARLATHADEIDILFSDIVMPGGIGGWELAERALRQKPEIALLLTSGYQMESLLPLMKTMPSVTVLNKPYRKLELAEKLKEVLARRNRLRPMG